MNLCYKTVNVLCVVYNVGITLPLDDLHQLIQNIMHVGSVVEKVCRAESRISAQTMPE